jgi:hypothetical protein
MKALEKKQVLSQINSLQLIELIELIDSGDILLDEMVNEGLSANTVTDINNHYDSKKQQKVNESEIIELCAQIEKGAFNVERIKTLLMSDKVTEQQLLKYTSLTQNLIDRIQYYQKTPTNFRSWSDLPPLEQNRTDLYFFGQPGSGKSCILASIFYYLRQNGMIINDAHNPQGNIYRNQLTDEIEVGILPDSTQRDGVNYIPIELRNYEVREYKHPLNFIEMSGELFDDAYATGISDDNLAAKNYLESDNKKLIYFVLDYFMHNKGVTSAGASQTSKMEHILSLLDDFGILNNTDGIFIIISKSDLFPIGVDRNQYALDFLQNKYRNFLNNIKELQEKYDFEIKLYPYSIGDVKFQNLLTEFNTVSPEEVIQDIMDYTFVSKKPWFKRLF